jgi:two-component system, response regulator PdtaR
VAEAGQAGEAAEPPSASSLQAAGFGESITLWNRRARDVVLGVMVSSRPDPSQAEGNVRPAIILVVEDEILIRAAVAEYLRILGYTVVEAADAAEATAVFSSGEPIDVVLCDVDLPGTMNGLSLARWINRRRSAPPVLLTSGRGIACSTGEKPADFFIAKPYRLRALAERLELMLASGDSSAEGRSEPEPR